jgi:SAM-dependent methyltransferase
MHPEAFDFVAKQRAAMDRCESVVEFGSLDINGSVRSLFDGCRYVGVDLVAGAGVDVVADASEWEPAEAVDCVVSCEVFEHLADWPALVAQAADILRPGGKLIVTCAGPGRGPHSAVDGNALRPDEHYGNVHPAVLADVLNRRFVDVHVEHLGADVRASAVKPR